MKIDLRGRIRNTNLATSHYLMPVFESIVNAINSIDESGNEGGKIDVYVERCADQLNLDPFETSHEPVHSFVIIDNGIGFNDANYESFCTADSTFKLDKGGKGIGRLLWLKAFARADIESHYLHGEGSLLMRKFTFRETAEGIEDLLEDKSQATTPKTIVRLENYREPYRSKCPRSLESIAVKIIEHFLAYFALETCPSIVLHDAADGTSIDLQSFFNRDVKKSVSNDEYEISGQQYQLTHFKLNATSGVGQKITFCAQKRAVVDESLLGRIQGISSVFKETDESHFVYAGYVSSPYLDEKVNNERDGFNIPLKRGDLPLDGEPSWEDILEASYNQANVFLDSYTRPANEANFLRIQRYIQEEAPQYRPLLKHKLEEIKKIPPNLTDEKLGMELHRLYSLYETDLKARFQNLLTKANNEEIESLHRQINGFIDEWNEDGKAKLADHVAYRKATLALLQRIINRQEGKFALEKTIHNMVLPMRLTSDDVVADNMNLWIIDERLAYHSYLASDVPFEQMKDRLVVEGRERPDLLVFQTANAFIEADDTPSSVVIVEFKHPMRDDYTDEENPIEQVLGYIERINSGKAVDRGGRRIPIPHGVPFYAYIVADITPKLELFAKRNQLQPTYDSKGYFGFHNPYNCYFEIIGFDKLVIDAKRRNALLFDKLGIK